VPPKPAFPSPAATLPGEADILANVLADLSDDNAKLVYADWLEERDDKRGPFLREFVTAYRAGKKLPPLKAAPKVWRDLIGLTLMVKLQHSPLVMRDAKILSLARPAINFDAMRAAEKTISLGASKLGGGPDMPEGAEWPVIGEAPLSFLGQFNLAELHASPVARDLPATGLFLVFARYDEDDGNDDFPKGSWRLLYFPDTAKLTRCLPPEPSFRSCRVVFNEVLTLPENGPPWGTELGVGSKHLGHEAYYNLHMEMCPGDHFLGYPFTIQGDVLGKKSVRHLLTIGGNDAAGWEWGDGGALYFTLPEADLKQARFDRVKMEMQCG
jgi:uncharacterized protein (TIGR02996 family)